jgi:hypothetical protein
MPHPPPIHSHPPIELPASILGYVHFTSARKRSSGFSNLLPHLEVANQLQRPRCCIGKLMKSCTSVRVLLAFEQISCILFKAYAYMNGPTFTPNSFVCQRALYLEKQLFCSHHSSNMHLRTSHTAVETPSVFHI